MLHAHAMVHNNMYMYMHMYLYDGMSIDRAAGRGKPQSAVRSPESASISMF